MKRCNEAIRYTRSDNDLSEMIQCLHLTSEVFTQDTHYPSGYHVGRTCDNRYVVCFDENGKVLRASESTRLSDLGIPYFQGMMEHASPKLRDHISAVKSAFDFTFDSPNAFANALKTENLKYRRLTLYREDSTTTVVYEPVKHYWYEANGTILVIAYIVGPNGEHNYAHWPVSRFVWFRDEKLPTTDSSHK